MMAEIHPTVTPNMLNEANLVYDILTTTNYHLQDFSNSKYNIEHIEYNNCDNTTNVSNLDMYNDNNMNLTSTEIVKVPINSMLQLQATQTHNKMLNYKNNGLGKNMDRRDYKKTRNNFRSIKPNNNNNINGMKGYEKDESCTSMNSSRNRSQTNETISDGIQQNKFDEEQHYNNNNKQNENFNKYQQNYNINVEPNMYHHRINTVLKNKHHHTLAHHHIRDNYSKNYSVMLRRAHGLMERFKSRSNLMKINRKPKNLLNGGPWDQLNIAIWDMFYNKAQKEETYINKLNLWKSVFLYITKCLNSYGLFMVGSTMSGFGLEGSDIDMCLLTKPILMDPRVDSLNHLGQIRQLLIKDGLAVEAFIIMAKVPILKFKNKETGFEVDLNCNNSVGIRNTHLLHTYARLDWRVRPLVVVIKLWAQANNINDAKNMTISSYSWALMVIHYLQCGVSPPVLPCLHTLVPEKFNSNNDNDNMDVQEEIELIKEYESYNTSCLGDLLIGFLQYYSYFNFSQYAISVRAGCRLLIDECRYMKSPKNDPNQWKCLCIEEPFDFSNTARSVFDLDIFEHIKEIILYSYKELARNKTLNYILPVNLNQRQR